MGRFIKSFWLPNVFLNVWLFSNLDATFFEISLKKFVSVLRSIFKLRCVFVLLTVLLFSLLLVSSIKKNKRLETISTVNFRFFYSREIPIVVNVFIWYTVNINQVSYPSSFTFICRHDKRCDWHCIIL